MSIFGPLIDNSAIEDAAFATLEPWISTFLAEVERQRDYPGGAGTIQRPRSYQAAADFQNWPESQLPALVVVCNGSTEDFERQGGGRYGGWFELIAGCLVEDTTEVTARKVANLYQSAIEGVLVKHGSLGGLASETRLMRREPPTLPDVENRTLAIARSTFHVFVDQVVTQNGGPKVPPADPLASQGDDPVVQTVNIAFTAD